MNRKKNSQSQITRRQGTKYQRRTTTAALHQTDQHGVRGLGRRITGRNFDQRGERGAPARYAAAATSPAAARRPPPHRRRSRPWRAASGRSSSGPIARPRAPASPNQPTEPRAESASTRQNHAPSRKSHGGADPAARTPTRRRPRAVRQIFLSSGDLPRGERASRPEEEEEILNPNQNGVIYL